MSSMISFRVSLLFSVALCSNVAKSLLNNYASFLLSFNPLLNSCILSYLKYIIHDDVIDNYLNRFDSWLNGDLRGIEFFIACSC